MKGRHPHIPFIESPNAQKSGSNQLRFIILHGSGGSELGSETWIVNPAAQVSYHYFIGKTDVTWNDARQFVRDYDIAWHAGKSRWIDQPSNGPATEYVGLNQCSIGVCLESLNRPDEHYPEMQLALARDLVRYLMQAYSIPIGRVLTHRMISDPVGRKVDPVNFPYEDFIRSLGDESEVTLRPRMQELHGLRLFLDNEFAGDIHAARVVGDKLYINRAPEDT